MSFNVCIEEWYNIRRCPHGNVWYGCPTETAAPPPPAAAFNHSLIALSEGDIGGVCFRVGTIHHIPQNRRKAYTYRVRIEENWSELLRFDSSDLITRLRQRK